MNVDQLPDGGTAERAPVIDCAASGSQPVRNGSRIGVGAVSETARAICSSTPRTSMPCPEIVTVAH